LIGSKIYAVSERLCLKLTQTILFFPTSFRECDRSFH